MSNIKTFATPELLLGSILNNVVGSSSDELLDNPIGFIKENVGIDFKDNDIIVVENSNEVMHLALPYYDFIVDDGAEPMDDQSMADATGAGSSAAQIRYMEGMQTRLLRRIDEMRYAARQVGDEEAFRVLTLLYDRTWNTLDIQIMSDRQELNR